MHAYALLADGIDMHAFRFLLGDVYAGTTVIHDRLVVVAHAVLLITMQVAVL